MVGTSPIIASVEEFEAFVAQLEHVDRLYEYLDGEIVEVVATDTSAALGARLAILIGGYALRHELGYVTGANTGYRIGNDVMIPDFAYIAKGKRGRATSTGEFYKLYSSVVPDLVIEVKSARDSLQSLRLQAQRYLAHGVRLVWLVFPDEQVIESYDQKSLEAQMLNGDAELSGEEVLPGFSLAVNRIFVRTV
ncbi:MAG: Uma2 family endonuclease [Anaerolineae bacterium]